MKYLIIFFVFIYSFSSYSITKKDCERLYKNNDLFCSVIYWDRTAQMTRKGVLSEYQLYKDNRVTGYIHNKSGKERYVHIRFVLHGADLEALTSDSHTITILQPNEKSKFDFIFHEKSKKPLDVEGPYLRVRNFEVK